MCVHNMCVYVCICLNHFPIHLKTNTILQIKYTSKKKKPFKSLSRTLGYLYNNFILLYFYFYFGWTGYSLRILIPIIYKLKRPYKI